MAITTVSHRPHTYTPAWGPVVWTVLSNSVNQTNFKYVFDIYKVGGTGGTGSDLRVARVKQRPNPTGYASIDIAPMVQPWMTPADALFEVDRISGLTQSFYQSPNLISGYYVLAGEEFSGTIYTGLTGATAGDPAYRLNSRWPDYYVRTLASSMNTIQATTHDLLGTGSTGATTAYGTYIANVMGWSGPGGQQFLTDPLGSTSNPYKIRVGDRHTLSFINRSLGDAPDYDTPAMFSVLVNGVTQITSSAWNEIIDNGAGPRTALATPIGATAWTTPNYEYTQIAVGPIDLGLTATAGDTYSVTLNRWSGMSHALIGGPMSEPKHFQIYEDCEGQFPSIRFSWLNKFGGRDYFNFNQYFETQYDSANENYFKDPNQWSSTAWSLKPWNSGNFTYNKVITRTINFTSDWLNEVEMAHLLGMFESPNVLVYLPDETYPQTCQISNKSYIVKELLTQKLYNLEFSAELSFNDRVQNT